ncbi:MULTISPECIES: hypothetical protein [Burkholderia]|uniref:hypothetical protein n=1 Tax=Burkholderia TaxID=32008 RepID=UPI000A7C0902|nr:MULTISPECIES: hypothetical protein [Burkholderia]MBG0864556.1 hypothetical protein [Burkholderia sp. 9779_493]MBO1858632.1 hypothetical protein [Burkholderia cenocepacia]MBR7947231.1 hypothetical protein [Burkholderia cenocepacia]MBR8354863.1 hypothetical protein [Burkholderia cenocepacia]MCW3536842.1 hypothetical protein [Burkholderia cenocepacia]
MNAILPAASVPLRRKRGIAAVRGGLRRPTTPDAPHIVLPAPRNTRRFCVSDGAKRRARGFLP